MDFSGVCSQVAPVDRLIRLCLLWDETIFPVAEIIFAFLDLRFSSSVRISRLPRPLLLNSSGGLGKFGLGS